MPIGLRMFGRPMGFAQPLPPSDVVLFYESLSFQAFVWPVLESLGIDTYICVCYKRVRKWVGQIRYVHIGDGLVGVTLATVKD